MNYIYWSLKFNSCTKKIFLSFILNTSNRLSNKTADHYGSLADDRDERWTKTPTKQPWPRRNRSSHGQRQRWGGGGFSPSHSFVDPVGIADTTRFRGIGWGNRLARQSVYWRQRDQRHNFDYIKVVQLRSTDDNDFDWSIESSINVSSS